MPVTELLAGELLQWRDRLDRVSSQELTSNHKIVIVHLEYVFRTSLKNEIGFYLVTIGKLPSRYNLTGMTGLSDWTIRTVIDELSLNGFLKRILAMGTPENEFRDTKLYLKPTKLWVPEKIKILEKSVRRKRIARCPHCKTSLAKGGYAYVCKSCGSTFEEPFFTYEEEHRA